MPGEPGGAVTTGRADSTEGAVAAPGASDGEVRQRPRMAQTATSSMAINASAAKRIGPRPLLLWGVLARLAVRRSLRRGRLLLATSLPSRSSPEGTTGEGACAGWRVGRSWVVILATVAADDRQNRSGRSPADGRSFAAGQLVMHARPCSTPPGARAGRSLSPGAVRRTRARGRSRYSGRPRGTISACDRYRLRQLGSACSTHETGNA